MSGASDRVLGRAEAILQVIEAKLAEFTEAAAEVKRLNCRLETAVPEIEALRSIVPEIEDTLAQSRPPEFLTVPELARLMKVGPATVKRLYYGGTIPGYREVKKGWLRFDWSEVRASLKEHAYHEAARV